MAELENLKEIIEEELQDIEVSNKLRKLTLNRIFHSENNFWFLLKRNWMKMTTVFSLFVLMLILGINITVEEEKPLKIQPENEPFIYQLIASKNNELNLGEELTKTTEDNTNINP